LINVIPIKSTIPDITLLKLKTPIDKNKPFNIKKYWHEEGEQIK
jgi:hypothetical protein